MLDLPLDNISLQEVEQALNYLKNWKALGLDGITAEMLKVEREKSPRMLTKLLRMLWDQERIPSEWELSPLVTVPKKGDLTNCNNHRGIALTSLCLKLFSLIILKRIETTVDQQLRDEQAGFRNGR